MSDAIEKRSTKTPAGARSREAVVARLRSHADEIREQGIVSLSIFGSRARGEERPDSDLDVLIAYDPRRPFTLYDLARAERILSLASMCTHPPATASARASWTAS